MKTIQRINTVYYRLLLWPLFIAAGRLAFRMVMNVWDMIES